MTDTTGTAVEDRLRALLDRKIAAARTRPAAGIPRRPDPAAPAPLSLAQARLWLLSQLDPDDVAYLMPLVLRLSGAVDVEALTGAVRDVIRRHDALRRVVRQIDGEPMAVAVPVEAVPITVEPAADDLDERLHRMAHTPFALDTEPPLRAAVYPRADGGCVLALTLHHIAGDAWSLDVLLADLAAAYAARTGHAAPPAAPALDFADVAAWQRARADGAALQGQLDWWASELAGLPAVTALPTDRPRRAVPSGAAGTVELTVPAAVATRVRQAAAETGGTPFMVYLAALQALLARLADTHDVAVGVPESGRRHPGTEGVVGCLLNTLVLRGDLSGDPAGRELLGRTRDRVLEAFAHAEVGFEQVVERVVTERVPGATPLYQVQLNYLADEAPTPDFPGLAVEADMQANDAAKFDLNLYLSDAEPGGPASGEFTFRRDLFDDATAEALGSWFVHLLGGLVSDLDAPVGSLPLAEVTAPVLAGPRTPTAGGTVHGRFEQWAERTPDRTAVVAPDGELAYGALEGRANQFAHRLSALGVRRDEPVAILLEPSTDLAAAILAALKAGGAYLPIDTGFPAARIEAMLNASGARVLVTDRATAATLPDAATADRRLVLTGDPSLADLPRTRPRIPDMTGEELAHTIFTSGSTGEPKGAMIEHRGVLNCVDGFLDRIGDAAGGSFAVISTIAADLGLAGFHGALLSGGTLHLVPRETATDPVAFAGYLRRHPVDVVKCVPSHLSMLAAHGELADVLPRRLLVFGGEAVPWPLVERIRGLRPELAVHTHYGPTESSMFSFVCDTALVPADERDGIVPLGTLLPNIAVHVVDRAGAPLPAGVPGELTLVGAGVGRGYAHRPELTARSFTPGPLGEERAYRTGDLVRVRADGTVEFLGRLDDQVKVRGHRIELSEVALACRALPGVHDAFVLPVGDAHERRLAAWVVPEPGTDLDVGGIRGELRRTLADYMVPALLRIVPALPLNPNGKVDRAALTVPDAAEGAVDGAGRAPESATERLVAEAWREVLGIPAPAAEDDFFAVGGHSFAATRVAGRLRQGLGRDVPLRTVFDHPVLADLARALDEQADAATGAPGALSAIARRADPGRPVPLTPAQARLWFLAQYDADSSAYNVPLVLRLRGAVDTDALTAALGDLVERHEILRTTVAVVDGEPMAAPRLAASVPITVDPSPTDRDARVAALTARPFTLDREPPARFTLFTGTSPVTRTSPGTGTTTTAATATGSATATTTGPADTVLAMVFHHIAVDFWSLDLILRDLFALYAARTGEAAALPAAALQYADYARWLAGHQDVARDSAHLDWWEGRLAGAAPVLDLPTDRPRPAVAAGTGGSVPVVLPPDLTAAVRRIAAETDTTVFQVLLAAWQTLLGRLAGVDDVVVGVPVSGRHHPDTEQLVGCFVNTLPMRTDLSGDPTAREVLARVRGTALDAMAHGDIAFERIVDRLRPERTTAHTPIFQTTLNVLDSDRAMPAPGGVAVDVLDAAAGGVKFDLGLVLGGGADGYEGELAYRTDIFDRARAARTVTWFTALLRGFTEAPDAPVRSLVLEPVTGPTLAGPVPERAAETALVHQLVERWADRTPDAAAVIDARGTLSYAELDARANRLAHRLIAEGVRADQPVGILLEPGAHLAVAILGILKAGGGYLPFDTRYPVSRIRDMLAIAGARTVLTSTDLAGLLDGEPSTVIAVDDPGATAGMPGTRPDLPVDPSHLVHVIFTSGSTGAPKGVAVEHRNVLHYLGGILDRLDARGASFAMVSTPAADFGLTCVYGALTTGGVVHLVDRDTALDPGAFAAYLVTHDVDVLKCVPSHLELLAAHGDLAGVLPGRLLILAGEACPWELVQRVRAAKPDLRVQSHYGHTESTMISLTCAVEEIPESAQVGIVPLGTPLPGVVGHLVDRHGQPVPVGMAGELVIGGPGVVRGYLGRPDLTEARFGADPLGADVRCYRTGDLLTVGFDGTVRFLGRVDDQVKIRGHRVELGEVTVALRDAPGVAEAVVLPVGAAHERRLAAWLVPDAGRPLDAAAVREALRAALPDYMIPTTLTVLDRLPLNANGKIDRAALPAPAAAVAASGGRPPGTPSEVRVAEVWSRILNIPDIGADDDFFALGGQSFAAVTAVRAIGGGLRVIDLFLHPTVAGLAAALDRGAGAADDGRLLHRLGGPAPGVAAQATVVCVPYGGGTAGVYQPFAQALGSAFEVLAVELPGHDAARPDETPLPVGDLVAVLAAELADRQVTSPVVVYGHCVGSALATALAQRLEADGRHVAAVVVGGSFPAARLPGRLNAWLDKVLPRDRMVSDRLFNDTLRATGGLVEGMDEAAAATAVKALRHDARAAQSWFGAALADEGRARLNAPVLCVVGSLDRATELYEERHREWGAFTERVELAVLPGARHYFLRDHAEALATLVRDSLARWDDGDLPEPVDAGFVTGRERRRGLRAFFTVAVGQAVSVIGNELSAFALGVWAYQRSGRISDLALVVTLAQIPMILLTPVGGAVADRVDRRRVMLACDMVCAVAMGVLTLLMATHLLNMWSICAVVSVTSTAAAFQVPAYLAAVVQLVPKPYLTQASALAEAGVGLGTVVGPLAGGPLVLLLGLPWLVGIDAATFVVGVATLLAVRFPERMFFRREEPFRSALTGGWRFIVRRRPLLVMVGYFAVVNYFTAVMWVGLTPLVLSIGSAGGLGVVTAIGGVGAVIGTVIVVAWGGTRRRATGMIAFVIGSGVGVAVMGVVPSTTVIAIGFFIRLACMNIGNAHWLSLLQTKVGEDLLGRVLAVNITLATLVQPLGFLTVGPLADHVFRPLVAPGGPLAGSVGRVVGTGTHGGIALFMVVSGIFMAAWGAFGLRFRRLRYMEDELPDAGSLTLEPDEVVAR
ncbi:amino acid adenylation domain-containing protein [Streptomyces sp. NPDC051976]|uniref:non-ribosomal peptide synthetase/MFS transporter n=1 Tax=Streptomyces sp. NPDC051976 TaxID=3154947 RepID=UPI00343E80E8